MDVHKGEQPDVALVLCVLYCVSIDMNIVVVLLTLSAAVLMSQARECPQAIVDALECCQKAIYDRINMTREEATGEMFNSQNWTQEREVQLCPTISNALVCYNPMSAENVDCKDHRHYAYQFAPLFYGEDGEGKM